VPCPKESNPPRYRSKDPANEKPALPLVQALPPFQFLREYQNVRYIELFVLPWEQHNQFRVRSQGVFLLDVVSFSLKSENEIERCQLTVGRILHMHK